jgi:predicted nucleic acid-binding protein
VTSNVVIDETLTALKINFGNEFAQKFFEIIDESVLSINLKVDWISRRIRRNALNNFLKTGASQLQLRHYYINESLKRKKIDIVFSYDQDLKAFDFPVMPQNA